MSRLHVPTAAPPSRGSGRGPDGARSHPGEHWVMTLYFDGRDVAEETAQVVEVIGYCIETCPGCGSRRPTGYPVCCELAALAEAGWQAHEAISASCLVMGAR